MNKTEELLKPTQPSQLLILGEFIYFVGVYVCALFLRVFFTFPRIRNKKIIRSLHFSFPKPEYMFLQAGKFMPGMEKLHCRKFPTISSYFGVTLPIFGTKVSQKICSINQKNYLEVVCKLQNGSNTKLMLLWINDPIIGSKNLLKIIRF